MALAIGMALSFIVGVFFGVVTMALLMMSSIADDEMERAE